MALLMTIILGPPLVPWILILGPAGTSLAPPGPWWGRRVGWAAVSLGEVLVMWVLVAR